MWVEKIFIYLLFMLVGSALLSVVDQFLGIDFSGVDSWARVAHKSTYFLYGGLWVLLVGSQNRKRV